MIFAFENLKREMNFIDSHKTDLLPGGEDFKRLPLAPTVSTILRYWRTKQKFENFSFEDIQSITAEKATTNYIIASGVNHSPEQWVGAPTKKYTINEPMMFRSIFEWLSPKYLSDLQEGRAMLLLDQSHEGYQREWLWTYFHDELTKYDINPKALIYITGNGEADSQYQTWCNTHNLENRMCVIPLFHFENMIYTIHENNERGMGAAPSFEKHIDYKTNNETWAYNCLQKRPRNHRLWLFNKLREENLLDKGVCSMQPFLQAQTHLNDKFLTHEQTDKCNELTPLHPHGEGRAEVLDIIHIGKLNNQVCLESYLSVVSEASFCDKDFSVFISEKTFKSIVSSVPFMIYGNRNSLKHVRSMGYETFGDFIDESYDDMSDFDRMNKVVDNIKEVTKIKNHLAWYKDMEPILRHNFETIKRNSKELAPPAYIKLQNAWREYFNV